MVQSDMLHAKGQDNGWRKRATINTAERRPPKRRKKNRACKNSDDLSFIMGVIDKEAERHGLLVAKPSREETHAAFFAGVRALGIPQMTKTGRRRNFVKMSWTTAVREVPPEKRKRRAPAGSKSARAKRRKQDEQEKADAFMECFGADEEEHAAQVAGLLEDAEQAQAEANSHVDTGACDADGNEVGVRPQAGGGPNAGQAGFEEFLAANIN